ncbi:MAG: CARDB domain-containing protein, partial [Thermoplasmata archaeon]
MKTSKNFRCSATATLVLTMLIASTLSIPISIVHPAEGGKYGNIVPTTLELQLLEKINENRTESGAAPLKLNTSLWWVARAHSQDMIDYDFFDHKSSEEGQFNGATFKERVNDYAEYENGYIGECIALRSSGIDVEWVMSAWKNSPPHWEIIIDPNFREIGIGLHEGEWGGSPNAGLHTADFGGRSIAVDISVNDLDILFDPPSPYEGEEVNISVSVHNLGQTDAFPVMVEFFDGDPDSGGVQIGAELQVPHVLVQGESAIVNVTWDTTGKAGSHDIYVVVDGRNVITETNEGNNRAFKSLMVNVTNPPIHLSKGWNLASFPYVMSNASIEYVLGSIDGEYDAVQFFNSSDALDPWKHYHVFKPSSMNDLHDLDNKMGFWIHIIDEGG